MDILETCWDRVGSSTIADTQLHFQSQRLSQHTPCNLVLWVLYVLVADIHFRSYLAWHLQWISWLFHLLILLQLNLLQDFWVFSAYLLIVHILLVFQLQSLCCCAQLLSSKVRHLQETIIRQRYDQSIHTLKGSPTDKNGWFLKFGCPYQSHIFVNHEEILKRSHHRHETGRI